MTTVALNQDINQLTNQRHDHFEERQTFMNTLVIAMLSTLIVLPASILGLEVMRGRELTEMWPLVPLLSLPLWLLLSLRLTISIDKDGLKYRYFPFIRTRHIPFESLSAISLQTYDPLTDYGGWGLKWGTKGWSYSVYGDDCLLLTFKDGHQLLLGIQQKDQWRQALKEFAPTGLATEQVPNYKQVR